MGIGSAYKSCYTNADGVAPNPNPGKWELLAFANYSNGYVMKVRYIGCTNFEGVKVMVYKGTYKHISVLDPHFSEEGSSPFARFKPTLDGWNAACELAGSF